jgi:hypothetical protein
MPEGSKQAAILIATSFRAMNRAARGREETLVSDATVLILFAGFYVEATLNYIADITGNGPTMAKFLEKRYPGMQDKFKFRNDISHGQVNKCAASLVTAMRLRQNAKDLVATLYDATSKAGLDVPRITTYQEAIASFTDVNPTVRCK